MKNFFKTTLFLFAISIAVVSCRDAEAHDDVDTESTVKYKDGDTKVKIKTDEDGEVTKKVKIDNDDN